MPRIRSSVKLASLCVLLCWACSLVAADLSVYAPSSFAAWLCQHIGSDKVQLEDEVKAAEGADLILVLFEEEAKGLEGSVIVLSDGLPKIALPQELVSEEAKVVQSLWLDPTQVLFMATGLGDILAEYDPEASDSFFEAVGIFSTQIRLGDFQIKGRLRSLSTPLKLSLEDARILYPFLKHYGLEYILDASAESAISETEPRRGEKPTAHWMRVIDQLLKSE